MMIQNDGTVLADTGIRKCNFQNVAEINIPDLPLFLAAAEMDGIINVPEGNYSTYYAEKVNKAIDEAIKCVKDAQKYKSAMRLILSNMKDEISSRSQKMASDDEQAELVVFIKCRDIILQCKQDILGEEG